MKFHVEFGVVHVTLRGCFKTDHLKCIMSDDVDVDKLLKENRRLVQENESLREEAAKDRHSLTEQLLKARQELSVANHENSL